VYFVPSSFHFFDRAPSTPTPAGPLRTARISAVPVEEPLDPTGCGDVFGATIVSCLARGQNVESSLRQANVAAAKNLAYRGATHLHRHLQGEIVTE
jgi:sugar/nucleoside kinase (ribokinase family)